MSLLAITCPHCHVEFAQFRSVIAVAHRIPGLFTVFFICNACESGVTAEVAAISRNSGSPHDYGGDLIQAKQFQVAELYPKPPEVNAPEHTLANVAAFYVQAQDNLRRKNFDAAGAMFRKALDTATKAIDKGLKGNLNDRIDKLATDHKITPAMKEWAHAIRLEGNDAVHDEEPFGEDDAKQLASFTEIFLLYAFTLPGMLEARKKKATASGHE